MKYTRQTVIKSLPLLSILIIVFTAACSGSPLRGNNQLDSSTSPLTAEVAYAAGQPAVAEPQESTGESQPADLPAQPASEPALEIQPVEEPVIAAAAGVEAPAEKASAPAGEQSSAVVPPAAEAPAVSAQVESKPQIGFLAPDFSLQTLDGQVVRLADLRGKAVVISYWATWCVPCKAELPIMQKLSQEYQAQGIQFLLINAIEQDGMDNVMEYVTQSGFSLPILLDQGNQFHNAYEQLFFPTSYYIDANGIIQDIKLGDAAEADIREKISKLLAPGL